MRGAFTAAFLCLFGAARLTARAGFRAAVFAEAAAAAAAPLAFLTAAQRFRAAAMIRARPAGLSRGFACDGAVGAAAGAAGAAGARPPILCRKAAMCESISSSLCR